MHITFSTYGFWPPNDPRGSGSTEVRAQHLYEVGGPTAKVDTRHSVANRPHDYQLRLALQEALKYPPVIFTVRQYRAVGQGICAVCPKIDLVVHALAVMPDHVHLVVRHHHLKPDALIACLQRAATKELNKQGVHPLREFPRPNGKLATPWTKKGWTVFLDTEEAMHRAIRYVEMNIERADMPIQQWPCIKPFDG